MVQTGKRPPGRRKKPLRAVFYIDAANEHRWRIKSGNGRVIADSGEGYKRLADCQGSLRSLFSAKYVEVYLGADDGR